MMNDNEIKILINRALANLTDPAVISDGRKQWIKNLYAHVAKYDLIDVEDLQHIESIKELFNSEAVCSTGQASTTPIDHVIGKSEFRVWLATKALYIRAEHQKGKNVADDIKSLFDAALEIFRNTPPDHKKIGNKPWLKLTRVFCTLFPDYFTAIGNQDALQKLYVKLFGTRGTSNMSVADKHYKIKQTISAAIGEYQNDEQRIIYCILPWEMYECLETKA